MPVAANLQGDVRQIERTTNEVLAERLDQDVVGAQRAESLGQRRRQQDGLVVPGGRNPEFPLYAVGAGRGDAGQYEIRVRRGGRGAVLDVGVAGASVASRRTPAIGCSPRDERV